MFEIDKFRSYPSLIGLILLLTAVILLNASAQQIDFNLDIRPILSDNCFACHGPDEKKREADLRFDTKAGAFSSPSGYPVIVPGKPKDSELHLRITSNDDMYRMPPPEFGKTLTEAQIELMTRWLKEGAKWGEHWSFTTPTRPDLPTIKNPQSAKNPIDHFIRARLESEGLPSTKEADKRTLIRRVSLDLTGLPPTRQEISEFLEDARPDAYERLVNRLLAKPQYGEHMGRFWLDVARYGDTHGLHLDNYREMWPYRDWVVKAFNANMPFDQFTIEQLAGDLLPEPTLDQRIATGFSRCNVSTSEGGSIDEEYYVRYAVDRTSTTGTVWMGLTLGCAVCHEHKYDPISQKEFYQLYAYFNNITEKAMDGNKKDPAPIVKVPSPEQSDQLAKYDDEISELDGQMKVPMPAVDTAQAAWETTLTDWQIPDPHTFTSKGGATLKKLEDGSILASGENPKQEVYEIVSQISGEEYTAIRLEGLRDDSLPEKGAGRSKNGNVVLTEFEAEIASSDKPDEWQPIRFVRAWADYEQRGDFAIANAIDGKSDTGWATEGFRKREDRQALFLAEMPFGHTNGSLLKVWVKHESASSEHQFGRIRLALTKASGLSRIGSPVTLDEWHSLGPFPADDGNLAFHRKYDPEGKRVNLSQEFKLGEKSLKWTKQPDWIDENVHTDLVGENCATYLYRNINSATKQRVALSLGSDDALKVWLNQQEVFSKNIERAIAPNAENIQIELNSGNNELVLKVVNYAGAYGFSFRLDSDMEIVPANVVDAAKLDREKRSDEKQQATRDYFRESVSTDAEVKRLRRELADVRKKRTELDNSLTTTLVMEERKEPRGAYILERGEYTQRREQVYPATPAILPPPPTDAPKNRLGFARWLVDPTHPLTARVAINRFWQSVFGTGLVKTSEDFGSQGTPPSHAKLLDWLATEFISSGWDTKYMMKLMVTSATYRQTAQVTSDVLKRDPENRLFARGPRFRLDAEMMRDQALALGGLLHGKIGGPSVKPPQPEGLWYAVGYTSSNTAKFKQDKGADKVYRRSLYTFIKRTAPPPQMAMLDAPSRESCAMRRERTNTPLQALMLMNDPQYFEAARAFAERTIQEGGTIPEQRIAYAFEAATARLPDAEEVDILLRTFRDHIAEFQADPDAAKKLIAIGEAPPDESLDAVELAAWTMVTNLILNLDEVISKG